MKNILLVLLCFISINLAAEYESTFENSNFTIFTPEDKLNKEQFYNYNRFRITEHIRKDDWFITAIGDIENYLSSSYIDSASYKTNIALSSDTPFSTQTKISDYNEGQIYAQLYRLYAGYADEKHRVSFGLQKLSMGVGRIWTPTDLFNPQNPLALEPDEVYGVFSLAYTYLLSDLMQITTVVAQRKDSSFKYAGKLKGYFSIADMGVNMVFTDDIKMIGYEIEGELFSTAIELRSEGAWFENKILDEDFFQGIIGADYAFKNSLILTGEWLHTSKTFTKELTLGVSSILQHSLVYSKDYLGVNMSYEFDALLYGSMLAIASIDDKSFYVGPAIRYSLSDDVTAGFGAMLRSGDTESDFGNSKMYYVNLKMTF